jgi:hypothetical protein
MLGSAEGAGAVGDEATGGIGSGVRLQAANGVPSMTNVRSLLIVGRHQEALTGFRLTRVILLRIRSWVPASGALLLEPGAQSPIELH